MSVGSRLASLFGLRRMSRGAVRIMHTVRAQFDAAQTNALNRRHWRYADSLDPNAALSPDVRRTLRERSRYEGANNSYLDGMIDTKAADIVGTGPVIDAVSEDESANRTIEDLFDAWSDEINLPEKLLVAARSKIESGEVFLVIHTDETLASPIKLNLRVVETDQVSNPKLRLAQNRSPVDGIEYDANHKPIRYWILRSHPGAQDAGILHDTEADPFPADLVLHYFRPKRPGQGRGYPEVASSLPLWAYIRRFTLATVQSAETAANFAGVMQTTAPPEGGVSLEAGDTLPIERNALAALPEGWTLGQLKAEHPTTTFVDFVWQLLREAARCIQMPLNIALGDSSRYNYASGRLDHQTYDRSVSIERGILRLRVLEPLFRYWLKEAVLTEGLLPQSLRRTDSAVRVKWLWTSRPHADPVKEAVAQKQRLENNTTTLTDEIAATGRRFRQVIRQRAAENTLMHELGIPVTVSRDAVDPYDVDEDDLEDGAARKTEARRAA